MSMGATPLKDDGLVTPTVGAWSRKKYKHLSTYARMFATSMKNKWDCRVYIDLFAGAGRAAIRGTSVIVEACAILALKIPDRFDRYIFCELDSEKMLALKRRTLEAAPDADVVYVHGNVNEKVQEILANTPSPSPTHRVLAFCVADPCKLSDLRFKTIESLAVRFVDFLVLIPSYMDAHRNEKLYTATTNHTLDEYLDNAEWRHRWNVAGSSGTEFGTFIVEEFAASMGGLGYITGGIGDRVLVRSDDRNLPLYHLAFFSRNRLGMKFWSEARKYSDPQMRLFD